MPHRSIPTLGIPVAGAFDASVLQDAQGMPYGTHINGQWHVDISVNKVVSDPDSPIRRYRDRPQSYDAMIRRSAARFPDREAVVCGLRRVTWAEFDRMIEACAYGFVNEGLAPGERVVVMLDNRLEYLVAIMAVIRAGAIAIPIGTRLGPKEVEHILADSTPKFAVTLAEFAELFTESQSIRRVFSVADEGGNFAALAQAAASSLPALAAADVAMIVYTSGTTGKPKGACLTHMNFVHTCLHYLYALAIEAPLRSLLAVPATHIAGFGPLASVTLASGGTVVMCRQFKADDVLALIEKERITYAVLVPAMYQLLVMKGQVDKFDLSSWIYGVYGGAIMPPATIERFSQVAPSLRMINAYGATETCAVCTIIPPELTAEAPASVGLALECDEILVVAPDGRVLPDGETGELWIRGPNVSPGYWNNPEATSKEFSDGFWRSGDVGHRDARGLIYVSDRLKDMINRGGFKVFSAEVENALMGHEHIADCAVVGVPDPVLGEKTFAMVSVSEPDITAAELRAWLAARIADYKLPDYWEIQTAGIPRNQNGKVQKAEVRLRAAQAVDLVKA